MAERFCLKRRRRSSYRAFNFDVRGPIGRFSSQPRLGVTVSSPDTISTQKAMGRVSPLNAPGPSGRCFKCAFLSPKNRTSSPSNFGADLLATDTHPSAQFVFNASSLVSSHHAHNLVRERSEILQHQLILPALFISLQIDLAGSDEGPASLLAAGLKHDFHQSHRVILHSATAPQFRIC